MGKHKGYRTGGSSDQYMAPQGPYTGDGRTRRRLYSGVQLVFKAATAGGDKPKKAK